MLLKCGPEQADMNEKEEITARFLENRVEVVIGDITRQHVDAIVNAANWTLLGGGGVDGAIHRAGGPAILEECRELRRAFYPDGLPTGRAAITSGGNLSARHVIHTVGPIYGNEGGREAELLGACYRNSLALCCEHELSSVAFPAISTGAFGYPAVEAAVVSSLAIKDFLSTDRAIDLVRLVFFHTRDARTFINNHRF
jgi:O-acetyl-ADP-ribose deacetylase (regulator of RNase III)